jgi:hypothetical protein
VEYNNPGDAALMASLYGSAELTNDPAKQNSIDAVFAPALLRATHLKVSELVQKVSVLTAEVGAVKANQAQVGGVMGELHRLADSLAKLENLDKLPTITDSLQRVVDVLNKTPDTPVGQGQAASAGGRGYVS